MKYTEKNIIDGINAKIDNMYSDSGMRQWYKYRLPQYPKEIEQNVLEWINDAPITEVDCHGESVLDIMNAWNLDTSYIPLIIDGFIKFAKTNFRTSSVISNFMLTEDLVQ